MPNGHNARRPGRLESSPEHTPDDEEDVRCHTYFRNALIKRVGARWRRFVLRRRAEERAKRRRLLVNRLVLRRADEAIVDVIASFIRGARGSQQPRIPDGSDA